MAEEKRLPPLPGSDDRTLREDKIDRFYEKKPSEIWGGEINHTEMVEPVKCEHHFIEREDGTVMCERCKMGLSGGGLTIKDGHVFSGDQQLV